MTTFFVLNTCFECNKQFASAPYLARHLQNIHGLDIERRPSGQCRPKTKGITYLSKQSQVDPSTILRLGCPCCWFECHQDLAVLKKHVESQHLTQYVYDSDTDTSSSRHQSPAPTADSPVPMEDFETHVQEDLHPSIKPVNIDQPCSDREQEMMNILNDMVFKFKKLFN